MKISNLLTDHAVLSEIGARIARQRLDISMTQAEVAEQAGLAKRTVERIENGASVQLLSIIRVLRVLGLLSKLDYTFPEIVDRPMELLKRQGKPRERASSRRKGEEDKPWTWDDDA